MFDKNVYIVCILCSVFLLSCSSAGDDTSAKDNQNQSLAECAVESIDLADDPNNNLIIDYDNPSPDGITGNDPLVGYQWHLHNTNQSYVNDQNIEGDIDINAPAAHNTNNIRGRGIVVKVVDDGLDGRHPDLRIVSEYSFDAETGECQAILSEERLTNKLIDNNRVQYAEGIHGTAVAGIIAAKSGNEGVVGVAPGAHIAAYNFLSSETPTRFSLFDAFLRAFGVSGIAEYTAIQELAEESGVGTLIGYTEFARANDFLFTQDVLNYSIDFQSSAADYLLDEDYVSEEVGENYTSELDELYYDTPFNNIYNTFAFLPILFGRSGQGIVMVHAAGNEREVADSLTEVAQNEGLNLETVCQFSVAIDQSCKGSHQSLFSTRFMLNVGAVQPNGLLTSYSSFGSNMFITAPTSDNNGQILTTDTVGCRGGEYGIFRGDSGAYAIVAEDRSFEGTIQGELFSKMFVPDNRNNNCDYVSTFAGTSAAAPIVSGVVALVMEKFPGLNHLQLRHILLDTAKNDNDEYAPSYVAYNTDNTDLVAEKKTADQGYKLVDGWTTNNAGYKFSSKYGFGIVDAGAAVAYDANDLPEDLDYTANYILANVVLGCKPKTTELSALHTIPIADFNASSNQPYMTVDYPNLDNSFGSAAHNCGVLNAETPVNGLLTALKGQEVANKGKVVMATLRVKTTDYNDQDNDQGERPNIGNVVIKLTSPKGTSSVLLGPKTFWHGNTEISDFQFTSNAFYMEEAAGEWKIDINKLYENDNIQIDRVALILDVLVK